MLSSHRPCHLLRFTNAHHSSGWHFIKDYDCFVNGHYTDSHCTLGTSPFFFFLTPTCVLPELDFELWIS